MSDNSLLSKMLNKEINPNELSIEHYIVRHVKHEELYKSWQIDLDGTLQSDESIDLNSWLKNNIHTSILNLKNEDGEFFTTPYNFEISKQDKIGVIDLESGRYDDLKETKDKLIYSVSSESNNDDISKTNFQLTKLYKDDLCIYICFYGAVKKSTNKKKWLRLVESKSFHEAKEGVVNIGGDFDFIIENNNIYITNNRNFEYAFKYTELIEERRNRVVESIVALGLFEEDSKNNFLQKSMAYQYSRGLANIKDETILNIEEYYHDRCFEIKNIYERLEEATEEDRSEIESEFGILTDLTRFIDFENGNKIVISEEDNITPLMHFFQDKIMKSFLTERIETILGIDKS